MPVEALQIFYLALHQAADLGLVEHAILTRPHNVFEAGPNAPEASLP
jgi:hypothetical protein